ncbi:MAG: hypothetical protein KKD73_11805, partial [Proteobacteria bacterium]|nr:hypothetical protein [Pseudomonadota bacterium]
PFIPQGHKSRLSRQAAQLGFIPQGHKSRLSRQAAQLGFIPQGHKSRLSRQAAQLGFIKKISPKGVHENGRMDKNKLAEF